MGYREDFDNHAKQVEQRLGGVLPYSCKERSELVVAVVLGKMPFKEAYEKAKEFGDRLTKAREQQKHQEYHNQLIAGFKDKSNEDDVFISRNIVDNMHKEFIVYAVIKNIGKRYAVILLATDGVYMYDTYKHMRENIESKKWLIHNIDIAGNKIKFTTPVQEYDYYNKTFQQMYKKIASKSYKLGDRL